jgi:benzoyl-CoA-dihydrodiol lyase
VRGRRAKEWRLVDEVVKPKEFNDYVHRRARELAAQSDRPADASGVTLTTLARTIDEHGYHYSFVDVTIDRAARQATLTVKSPATRHRATSRGSAHRALHGGRSRWDASSTTRS